MTESYYDRRLREKAEAAAAEKKKQERAAHFKAQELPEIWKQGAANAQAWDEYIDRRIDQRPVISQRLPESLYQVLGEHFAETRRDGRQETKVAVEEAKREFTAAHEAFEQRLMLFVERRLNQHLEQTCGRKATEVTGGAPITDEQIQRAVEKVLAPKLSEIEQRFVLLVEQLVDQHIARAAERKEADLEAIARSVGERIEEPLNQFVLNQVRDAVEKALASKLTEIEQRLMLLVGQRFDQHLVQTAERKDADLGAIARSVGERIQAPPNQFVLDQVRDAVEKAFAIQLPMVEQRLKSVPGTLPVAKTWRPETVVYQAEFVVHDGALWQAKQDTAQSSGGGDWICVARAGRDAITPTVRGTYSADEKYRELDCRAGRRRLYRPQR